MKNKIGLIIGGGVLAVGAFLILSYMSKRKKIVATSGSAESFADSDASSTSDSGSASGSTTQTQQNTNLTQNASFPLKNGSRGKQVVELQKFLNTNKYADPKLVVDGVFGSNTERALANMYRNASSKQLSDYIKSNLFGGINVKQVQKPFYDIFIGKTQALPPALATTPTNPFGNLNIFNF